jgi:hypothetical protein
MGAAYQRRHENPCSQPAGEQQPSLLNATQTVFMFSNPRISPLYIFNGGFLPRHSSPDRRPPAQITRRESGVCECHPPLAFPLPSADTSPANTIARMPKLGFSPKIARKEARQVTSARATTQQLSRTGGSQNSSLRRAPSPIIAILPPKIMPIPRFQRVNLIFRRRNRLKADNGARKKAQLTRPGVCSRTLLAFYTG